MPEPAVPVAGATQNVSEPVTLNVTEPLPGEIKPPAGYEVEVDGKKVSFNGEDFGKYYKDSQNRSTWVTKLSADAHTLKTERKEFDKERLDLAAYKQDIDELRRLKESMRTKPEAFKAYEQLISTEKDTITKQVTDSIQGKMDDFERKTDLKEAVLELKSQFADFDEKTTTDFLGGYNLTKASDIVTLGYLAYKGSQFPQFLAAEKAKWAQGQQGRAGNVPSVSASQSRPNKPVYKTLEEAAQAAIKRKKDGG